MLNESNSIHTENVSPKVMSHDNKIPTQLIQSLRLEVDDRCTFDSIGKLKVLVKNRQYF